MLAARVLCSAGRSNPVASAWAGLKTKFKSRFMVGDTYEHYIPPSPEYQNHDSIYPAGTRYRFPAPGSQPDALIPRTFAADEFETSLVNREAREHSPPSGTIPIRPVIESTADGTMQTRPSHFPMSSWRRKRETMKRVRRFNIESGEFVHGAGNFEVVTYYPIDKYRIRDDWEQTSLIRDPRVSRL